MPHAPAPHCTAGQTHTLLTQFSPLVQLPQKGDMAPHAFVIVPHPLAPGQLGVGQKHVSFAWLQLSPMGHVGKHVTVPPHPLGA
jgi:hypothetical protein